MKRMKRTLVLAMVLAALLAALCPAALAARTARRDSTVVFDCDEELMPLYHVNADAGGEVPDEQAFLKLRVEAFSNTYGCDFYAGLMSDPAWMGEESFDAYQTAFFAKYPEALGDSAVCILYDRKSGGVLVHVGSGLRQDCDTAPVTAAILNQDEPNVYDRMVDALSALQTAIGKSGVPLLYCADTSHYRRLTECLEPLREKFTGPVFVVYESTEEDLTNRADVYANTYTMYRMENFFKDSIWIFYYRNTGDACIQLGSGLELRVEDIGEVEASFGAVAAERNYIGFETGIKALAGSLSTGREVPGYVGPLLLAVAVAVLALALVIEAAARKRGKPLAPAEAEK